MTDALARLRTIVGEKHVLTDPNDVAPYATDWRQLFVGRPFAIVRPGDTAQVAAIVKACIAERLKLVPQGGNTGLSAGAVPDDTGRSVVLSLGRLNRIRRLDSVGMTIELEAGCVLQSAQIAAEAENRLLPISLAAEGSAQIGGLVSTNAGGVNVLRYGMTRSLVLGLEVVTADGEVIHGLRHLRKDNAGYDWKQMFIGSEGTLGIVTAAVLRLMPMPRYRVTTLLALDSLANALSLLALLQDQLGDVIVSFELMSRKSLDLVRDHLGMSAPFAATPDWSVLVEAAASLPGLSEGFEQAVEAALGAGCANDGVIAQSLDQSTKLWNLRESITEAEHKAGGTIKHDISVPIDRIPDFVATALEQLAEVDPAAEFSIFGHLGDGNLHFNVLSGTERSVINRVVHDCAHVLGGSISAEHGIGLYRIAELKRYCGPEELDVMRRLKVAFDPENLLNPGKVLPG